MEFIVQTDFIPDVEGAKKAGLPELVRCKDCDFGKHCQNGKHELSVECHNPEKLVVEVHTPDWFCADGWKDDDGK